MWAASAPYQVKQRGLATSTWTLDGDEVTSLLSKVMGLKLFRVIGSLEKGD